MCVYVRVCLCMCVCGRLWRVRCSQTDSDPRDTGVDIGDSVSDRNP